MRIDILTLFPGMFVGPFQESILGRAAQQGLVEFQTHNIRDFATGRHKVVDDYPFGGGPGMVMKPEPITAAVEAVKRDDSHVLLMSAQGQPFRQSIAQRLSALPHLVLLCGHYEGVDERVIESLVDEEISVGDFVLTGGELPALVVCDAVVRLIPGVLGAEESVEEESFSAGVLEYPHYTRPAEFRGMGVPDVLLSGNHAKVARWRREQSLLRTLHRRPELLTPDQWDEMRLLGLLP
ncbi:MAG TPA: tRNA (guanosine(37)-N1)-methyltransferase TrmD [Chloroflexota bacterium]|nr:tRNA (guanosine(37)-N1)-methyltransferase TrmD [Chloroflexota bacterium]